MKYIVTKNGLAVSPLSADIVCTVLIGRDYEKSLDEIAPFIIGRDIYRHIEGTKNFQIWRKV